MRDLLTQRPTVGHALLALALIGAGAAAWMAGLRGPHWQGALLAIGWSWSRELAQSWRASSDFELRWRDRSWRDAGWPTGVAIAVALIVEVVM